MLARVEWPSIEGLTVRGYAGESDIPAMLAVHAGCREADLTDPYSVCYRVPNMGPELYAKDIQLSFSASSKGNVLILEVDGQMIGHSRLEWWPSWVEEEQLDRMVYLSRGWLLPEWRNKGLGSAMLDWAEARSREMNVGWQGAASELATNASDGEVDSIRLLTDRGYTIRFLSPELAHDLAGVPQVEVPEGFEIKPPRRRDSYEIAVLIARANAPSGLDDLALFKLVQRQSRQFIDQARECKNAVSRVAWSNGQIVGVHLCRRAGAAGDVGDIANVATHPDYRGKGVARALMFSCLHAMREEGCRAARLFTGIGTDRDAPPTGPVKMYLGFGFKIIAYHNRYRKPI